MNDLVNQNNRLAVSTETASLIQSSVAPNTIAAYRRATQKLEAWLNGQILTDGLLATYITELHQQGKSPVPSPRSLPRSSGRQANPTSMSSVRSHNAR